jgi:hypothetical protein
VGAVEVSASRELGHLSVQQRGLRMHSADDQHASGLAGHGYPASDPSHNAADAFNVVSYALLAQEMWEQGGPESCGMDTPLGAGSRTSRAAGSDDTAGLRSPESLRAVWLQLHGRTPAAATARCLSPRDCQRQPRTSTPGLTHRPPASWHSCERLLRMSRLAMPCASTAGTFTFPPRTRAARSPPSATYLAAL